MKQQHTGPEKLLLFIGSIGPLGHCPASGTVTVAVAGIPVFWLLADFQWWGRAIVALAVSLAAVWIHHAGDRILGQHDSRLLVWDEIAGFLVAIIFVPFTLTGVLLAFFLERFFDVAKIFPASWIDKNVQGGWGVVGDDIIAGIYTMLTLLVVELIRPGWIGT